MVSVQMFHKADRQHAQWVLSLFLLCLKRKTVYLWKNQLGIWVPNPTWKYREHRALVPLDMILSLSLCTDIHRHALLMLLPLTATLFPQPLKVRHIFFTPRSSPPHRLWGGVTATPCVQLWSYDKGHSPWTWISVFSFPLPSLVGAVEFGNLIVVLPTVPAVLCSL